MSNRMRHTYNDSSIDSSSIPDTKDDAKPERRLRYNVKGEILILDTRYKPLKRLGKGSSGWVVSARDNCAPDDKKKRKVAIKKVKDPFSDLVGAQRLLREVKLLKHFNHQNILSLTDMINPMTEEEFQDVYLVTDFMPTDLSKAMKNDLGATHIAFIIYQVLLGLFHMHTAGVIHRDIVSLVLDT